MADAEGIGHVGAHEEREALLASGDRYLASIETRFKNAGVETSIEVADGTPAHAILEVARSRDVSLIAMSTHGRTGPARWLLGSVAERVVHNSKIPVLLIRATG